MVYIGGKNALKKAQVAPFKSVFKPNNHGAFRVLTHVKYVSINGLILF